MALTPSTMLALGTQAPDFSLPDVVNGVTVSLKDYSGKKALLIMFICRHCPYVKHVEKELARLGRDYESTDLGIVAISSNDVDKHPEDSPESLKEMAVQLGFTFAFCFDGIQEVARSYAAACTPDFYVFDKDQKLVYRGQLDDSRPQSSKPVTGKDLRRALDAVLEGKPVSQEQQPSIGCNIKWRAGNEPSYFG